MFDNQKNGTQPVRKLQLEGFVDEITEQLKNSSDEYVFFIGAGASVSSGIQAAKTLVNNWLADLYKLEGFDFEPDKGGGAHEAHIQWAQTIFPDLDADNLAGSYSCVIEHMTGERPGAVLEMTSKLVEGKDPGPGYATLVKMMTETDFAHRCNHVFTTNFDDLVADACYLFTTKKPLSINDPALLTYLDQNSSRPIILKLHGDARTTPLHLERELSGELNEKYQEALKNLMRRKGLIFLGYGGHDQTIVNLLQETNPHFPIYWISSSFPDEGLGDWLRKKRAFWVQHRDFDELMLHLHERLDIDHPNWQRFDSLKSKYHKHFGIQAEKTSQSSNPKTKEMAQKAKSDSRAWEEVHDLLEYHDGNPSDSSKAIDAYEQAIQEFPDFAPLLGNYANFLKKQGDMGQAGAYYQKALSADPDHVNNLGNYALFLEQQGDMGQAGLYYQKALSVDPDHATTLGNYAFFLAKQGDMDQAGSYYQKALSVDPDHVNNLGNYALFLVKRGDMDQAEVYYQKALSADPTHAGILGNYALFLEQQGDLDQAEAYYQKALSADPDHVNNLGNYALFLEQQGEMDQAGAYYQKTLSVDPDHATTLGNYALFLVKRGDMDQAEVYFQKALSADPDHATTLGNYALFLVKRGDMDQAEVYFQKALSADPDHVNNLGNYANFLKQQGEMDQAGSYYQKALAVDPTHATTLGNYAEFLLLHGDRQQAIDHARDCLKRLEDQNILLCLHMMLYALLPDHELGQSAPQEINRLLSEGVRQTTWDFDDVLAKAKENGHPDDDTLEKLVKQIKTPVADEAP